MQNYFTMADKALDRAKEKLNTLLEQCSEPITGVQVEPALKEIEYAQSCLSEVAGTYGIETNEDNE